jgi:hypothetical protein
MKIMMVAAIGFLVVLGGVARADDVVPFFKPDHPKPVMYGPPEADAVATECAANDTRCIAEHDLRALDSALGLIPGGTIADCDRATNPYQCLDAVAMIRGDVAEDPILADPCSWVVRIDRGVATLYSRRMMSTRRVLDRGWHPAQFIGKCDVSTVGPAVTETTPARELPAFPWGSR